MRRSTAISQVLLLLAFYFVPLVAGTAVASPACCRRNGAHHCTMQERDSDGQVAFSSSVHCPYSFPPILLTHGTKLFMRPASFAAALPGSHEFLLHEKPGYQLAQHVAGSDNRGPPTLTL